MVAATSAIVTPAQMGPPRRRGKGGGVHRGRKTGERKRQVLRRLEPADRRFLETPLDDPREDGRQLRVYGAQLRRLVFQDRRHRIGPPPPPEPPPPRPPLL